MRAASASMPPVLTVSVTMGRPYVSAIQGTQKDVSSPPEKASRMGLAPVAIVVMVRVSASEMGAKVVVQAALCARAVRRYENRVVAGNRPDDFRPAGLVECRGHALGRARRRPQHGHAGSGRSEILHEGAHVAKVAGRERIF